MLAFFAAVQHATRMHVLFFARALHLAHKPLIALAADLRVGHIKEDVLEKGPVAALALRMRMRVAMSVAAAVMMLLVMVMRLAALFHIVIPRDSVVAVMVVPLLQPSRQRCEPTLEDARAGGGADRFASRSGSTRRTRLRSSVPRSSASNRVGSPWCI